MARLILALLLLALPWTAAAAESAPSQPAEIDTIDAAPNADTL